MYRQSLFNRLKYAWLRWRRPPQPYPTEVYLLGGHQGLTIQMTERLLNGQALPPRYRYRYFRQRKKDGTWRELAEPGSDLKGIQHHILQNLLEPLPPHPAAVGFRKGMSIADHAWTHAGAAHLITADIEDFFPSTRRTRIKEWWQTQNYDELQSELLTLLTTHRGALPQGAPTSPALSNVVNYEMDEALTRRATQSGGKYTRYGDDLAFSWLDGSFIPADFEAAVRGVLLEYGYFLNSRKGWQHWKREDEPMLTGVILKRNGDIELPPAMLATIQHLERTQPDSPQLAGYRGYRNMVKRKR